MGGEHKLKGDRPGKAEECNAVGLFQGGTKGAGGDPGWKTLETKKRATEGGAKEGY